MLLKKAHKLSSKHREAVEASDLCGCFYCVSTFKPEFIKEWIDLDQTALCPQCGIDSVLPKNNICDAIDLGFLAEMNEYWFKRYSK